MPDVQPEIRDWLHKQADWIQQAAEMLISAGSPSDADVQSLVARLKTEEGQKKTAHRTFDELGRPPTSAGELRLLDIGDISGIENLAPRTPLSFGTGNLCAIYGPNGSGKSGYTRLLKRAFGKSGAKELKPNVFQPPPTARKCKIGYQLAGAQHRPEWHPNDTPIDDLRAVDIFDSDIALNYLTGENSATLTPPTAALFEALSKLCDRVKAKLQAEQHLLVSALPALPEKFSKTPAGIAYSQLKSDLDETALQPIVQWRAEDQHELDQLTERLKTTDPAAVARKKRSTKEQIEQLSMLLRNAAEALSLGRIAEIRALRSEASAKRRVATESAQLATAKLDGVGTETWSTLWEAARKYSQTAYPGKSFPVTDDALCLLCQQELKDDAQVRLRDFESFVQGTVETAAKAAEGNYKNVLDALPSALTDEQAKTRYQAAGLSDGSWLERLRPFWESVRSARTALLDGEDTQPAVPVAPATAVVNELVSLSGELEREAKQHDEDAKNFDRTRASANRLILEARQWTAQQATAVRTEIGRLKQVAEYEEWKSLANSQPISTKAGDIASQVITAEFVKRFNRELKALGASRIKVELVKTKTEKGRALHKLRLKGAQSGQEAPDAVLSDGERRIVALAAFLADVSERPQSVPFVFDDPVSSLDDEFERCVAARLADLAKSRQVLVFTHRLSLYGATEDAAQAIGEKWKKAQLVQICIESFAGASGHPADQEAWNAGTAEANAILLRRLDEAKKVGDTDGGTAYRGLAQGICSDFRKLLERTVEDDLLNKVVKRHRRSVTTDNRLAALPRITQADCALIDCLMSKYSCYEHSQSSETPVLIPDEHNLREDLLKLQEWRNEFKKRSIRTTA